jgi:hypothetical protein
MRIGIDIGNVIIGGGGDDTQFFGDNYLDTPQVDGAFEAIRQIIDAGHEVFLVSKCSPKTQMRTTAWLRFWNFYAQTGVWEFPYYVESRKDKWPVARALNLD